MVEKEKNKLFDKWPEVYDRWFTTPIGALVKRYETELILDLLKPLREELILDAGCGTGLFTLDFLSTGSRVIGLDLSFPMLTRAKEKAGNHPFEAILGDMMSLPFPEGVFDKVVSITALEFIEDGQAAVRELFRVTKRGGRIVVATLNSLSPWAELRKEEARKGHALFQRAIFRSPDELLSLAPVQGIVRTAIHFRKECDPARASEIEQEGRDKEFDTGAFAAVRWEKVSVCSE
jgi:ubiquinone/menaquinone biosynthesis C-methylase UbiE